MPIPNVQASDGNQSQGEASSFENLQVGSLFQANDSVSSLATVGNGVLTGALLLGRFISRGGAQTAAFTDTTDTANNILTAFQAFLLSVYTNPATKVSQTFKTRLLKPSSLVVRYINSTADIATIAPGTGVTINGTATVAAGGFRDFLVTLNPAAGTVTMTNIGSGTD